MISRDQLRYSQRKALSAIRLRHRDPGAFQEPTPYGITRRRAVVRRSWGGSHTGARHARSLDRPWCRKAFRACRPPLLGAVPPSVCLPTRSPRGWLVVRPPSSSAAPTRFRRWPRCPGRPRQCRLARPLSQAAPPARHRARHWWPLPTHPRPHPQLPRRRVDPKGRNRVTRQEQSGRSYRVPEIGVGVQ